ncbi:hypothetical protein ACUALW_24745 [Bordetella bronchiseptica]|uniref:hypothetical protein n=1 Tax=Bordetella bronchiseptica TaxID=518 RepID=UPI00403C0D42
MLRRTELKRKTPLRATGYRRTPQAFAGDDRLSSGTGAALTRQSTLQRTPMKRHAPKTRARHEQATWEWAYTRWDGARTQKLGLQFGEAL